MEPLLSTTFRKSSDLVGVAAGAKITGKIETLNNIHGLYFYLTGSGTALTYAQIVADVLDVRVRLNGELIVEATGEQLLDLYKYHRDALEAHTVAGVLPILFTRQHLPVAGHNTAFALGMLGEDGKSHNVLTYELNFKTVSITADSGEVVYEHDHLAPAKLGLHVRLLRHDRTFSATGYQDITDLPKDKEGVDILAYHVAKGGITKLTVKVNGRDLYEETPYEVIKQELHRSGRIAQTDYTHIAFDTKNDLASMLRSGPGNIVDLLVKPYWGTSPAGSFQILAEEVHNGL